MLDPSKPRPSSNASLLNSRADTVKCCQSPGRSTNRTSTAWTPLSLISDITSAGFIGSPSTQHVHQGYRRKAPPASAKYHVSISICGAPGSRGPADRLTIRIRANAEDESSSGPDDDLSASSTSAAWNPATQRRQEFSR